MGQFQPFRRHPVYQTSYRHAFSAAQAVVVNSGAFPATPDKIPLSTAQSVKVLEGDSANSLTVGNIQFDDTNDRILLDPGVYRVEIGLDLLAAGTASDFSVALTTAAQAATDVSYANVTGAVVTAPEQVPFHTVQYITVQPGSSRALELHVAWTTAGATGTIRPGSYMEVRRLGNVDV
jgi:hypothetical protein